MSSHLTRFRTVTCNLIAAFTGCHVELPGCSCQDCGLTFRVKVPFDCQILLSGAGQRLVQLDGQNHHLDQHPAFLRHNDLVYIAFAFVSRPHCRVLRLFLALLQHRLPHIPCHGPSDLPQSMTSANQSSYDHGLRISQCTIMRQCMAFPCPEMCGDSRADTA